MYEFFTPAAARAVVHAQKEAARLHRESVGPEHILLGLVRKDQNAPEQSVDNIATRVLKELGISPEAVREQVNAVISRGNSTRSKITSLNPLASRTLRFSLDEARTLNNEYIGTEHLLLALLRPEDGIARLVFKNFDVDLMAVRAKIVEIVQARKVIGSAEAITASVELERGAVLQKILTPETSDWRARVLAKKQNPTDDSMLGYPIATSEGEELLFSFLSSEGRHVIALAQWAGTMLRDSECTPLHLLYGVRAAIDSSGEITFSTLGVTDGKIALMLVEQNVGALANTMTTPQSTQLSLEILKDAICEARRRGKPLADSEDIVLSLVKYGSRLSHETLVELGTSAQAVIRRVNEVASLQRPNISLRSITVPKDVTGLTENQYFGGADLDPAVNTRPRVTHFAR